MKRRLILGQWNAVCDRCGFWFKSSELKKDWQGLMVCEKDFEMRNPQDFIRVPTEHIAPPWTRPVPQDTFIFVCDLWSQQDRADYGQAGCMQVGFLTDLQLLADTYGTTCIAGLLIPGRAIADKI